jgi:predicted flap endonuclease-1-like 5' DNA nuclease
MEDMMPSDGFYDASAAAPRDDLLRSAAPLRRRGPGAGIASRDPVPLANPGERPMSLHISKLRGMDPHTRARLKHHGINYSEQLLDAAGKLHDRQQFAARSRIDDAVLWRLARRADLAQIRGIGAIFADMLELVGIDRTTRLAQEDPAALHRRLVELNGRERLARRAPTPEEVADWVHQARELPPRLDEGAQPS